MSSSMVGPDLSNNSVFATPPSQGSSAYFTPDSIPSGKCAQHCAFIQTFIQNTCFCNFHGFRCMRNEPGYVNVSRTFNVIDFI